MFYISFLLYIVLIALFSIIFFKAYKKLDCDLTLLFYCYFGKSLKNLNNKVVWITGASSGIGKHVAYEFAKKNCKLILSGTNVSRLENVKLKCLSLMNNNNTDNILIIPFDLSQIDSHQVAVDKALQFFKKIDILINNAGRSQRASFEDISIEVDKQIFNINVFGTLNLSRILLKHWLENDHKGHFVVVSSTAGIFPAPFSSSYTAAKHALHGYFDALNIELSERKISVTMVCPGPIVSNISMNAFTDTLGQKAEIKHNQNEKRLSAERCAYLIAVATVNKLNQVWISLNPVLFAHYLIQYMPTITKYIIKKVFDKKAFSKLRDQK